MDRRTWLAGAAALAGAAGLACARTVVAATADPQPDDLRSAAREAWLYGLPLIELARARESLIGRTAQAGARGFNAFDHQRYPADARSRAFSSPEADVLYSSAFIYLNGGAAQITVPATAGRYFLLTLADMYGNVLDAVEGRETGKEGRTLTVMGPAKRVGVSGYTAPMPRLPPLHKVIKAPGQWVWVLARTHLEGGSPADLAAARAIQDKLEIRVRSSTPPMAPPASIDAAWSDYFFAVQQLIEENPPPVADETFFRRLAPLQLGMDGGFERARFADADGAVIAAGVAEARTLALQLRGGDALRGWIGPRSDIAAFSQDYLYRAQSTLAETAAPPAGSVISLRALPPAGSADLIGGRRYRLALPPRLPASAFWSLTLYRVTADGRLFLAETPQNRFSLSSWTPGLARRADGWIEVEIGGVAPSPTPANWLPSPDSGAFTLLLRLYAPVVPASIIDPGSVLTPVEADDR